MFYLMLVKIEFAGWYHNPILDETAQRLWKYGYFSSLIKYLGILVTVRKHSSN